MLINLTNHPLACWSKEQRAAGEKYGEIVDIPFPDVDPLLPSEKIRELAKALVEDILAQYENPVVHVMGEMTLTLAIVSVLKAKGIKCIASTTKRFDKKTPTGDVIKDFKFAQFREYSLSDVMKFHQVSLKRNATYSWAVIILLALFEGSALMGIHMGHWSLWGTCMAVSAISIVSIWLYASRKWKLFTTANLILTKLLNNAIAPTTIGIVYLLLFIIHMGWLTDAAISLFLPVNKPQDVIFAMMVCCVGIAVLVCFFPKGKTEKNTDATKVFVTGISAIGKAPVDYDSLNLIPLVRILQLAEENDRKCKLLILLSDSFEKNERTGEVLSKVMGLVNADKCSSLDGCFFFDTTILNCSVNADKCSSLDGCATILDKLEMVIREIVRREFPGRPWLNAKLEIEFTSACDYNGDFETSFKILTPRVNELDDVDHLLYFNCTPGTSTIGSLLTLLAIDGDRRLYYYNQEKMPPGLTEEQKLKFRESMLKPVDKTKIPLYNLLSQAMEKF